MKKIAKSKSQMKEKIQVTGKELRYNISIENEFKRGLARLIKKMSIYTRKRVLSLYNKGFSKAYFAMDDTIGSQARMLFNEIEIILQNIFNTKGMDLFHRMLRDVNKYSYYTVKSSIKSMEMEKIPFSIGRMGADLAEKMKAITQINADLIKSIPKQYMNDIQGSVMRSIISGEGLKELTPYFSKYEEISERRAKNLALDQTRKAYNMLNESRMKDAKIKKFKWIHSGGGKKPRKSHQKISGEIFTFENIIQEQIDLHVPTDDQGIPGTAINCKCTMTPILDIKID